MSLNYKTLSLARDIELAFKNYLNTDSFPTAEWPAMALALAKVVEATAGAEPVYNCDVMAISLADAQNIVKKMSELDNAIADLVGL